MALNHVSAGSIPAPATGSNNNYCGGACVGYGQAALNRRGAGSIPAAATLEVIRPDEEPVLKTGGREGDL